MLTTCKHFDMVGNRCSRITDGKCNDLPDCEFKYIEVLKAENATYKANADAVHKYITQNEQLKTHIYGLEKKNAALKAENERLKKEFEIESLTNITTGETFYRSNKINKLKGELTTYGATGVCEVCSDKANKLADKYLGCLQEIKAIAMGIMDDDIEESSAYSDARQIIELITKAEEE